MHISNKEQKEETSSKINIATVGSKNRVCLPPNLVKHHNIKPKDNIVWLPKKDRNGKPYSIMHAVKPENFEIEDDEVQTIADTLK